MHGSSGHNSVLTLLTVERPMAERLLPFDEARLARFDHYVASFRNVFPRADQSHRFRAYLRGLLAPGERKNVESLAAAAAQSLSAEANLSQALQHFVSHSPWNADRLLAAVRTRPEALCQDSAAFWVVHDGVFVKKGRHSVGVQRQYARAVGKKLNCQIAVVVSQLGPRGYFPLSIRLYLPATWLRENSDKAEKTVPEEFARPLSRAEIALHLLDGLRGDSQPLPIVAEENYLRTHSFSEGLAERGLALLFAETDRVNEALAAFEGLKTSLGLDHFEGRTWTGWHHHASLVFAAYHFLAGEFLTENASLEGSLPKSPC